MESTNNITLPAKIKIYGYNIPSVSWGILTESILINAVSSVFAVIQKISYKIQIINGRAIFLIKTESDTAKLKNAKDCTKNMNRKAK